MEQVDALELRNNTRTLLERVEQGEAVTIAVSGRPVAVLQPVGRRPRWLKREEFISQLVQADPALTHEIAKLASDTTDDLSVNDR